MRSGERKKQYLLLRGKKRLQGRGANAKTCSMGREQAMLAKTEWGGVERCKRRAEVQRFLNSLAANWKQERSHIPNGLVMVALQVPASAGGDCYLLGETHLGQWLVDLSTPQYVPSPCPNDLTKEPPNAPNARSISATIKTSSPVHTLRLY